MRIVRVLRGVRAGLVACVVLTNGCGAGEARTKPDHQRAARPPAEEPRRVGEEFVMLIVAHLSAAELHCPVRIEEGRLRTLLDRHGLGLRDVLSRARSPELQSEVDKIALAYKADRTTACDSAWSTFGSGGRFGGFLQRR